MNFLVSEVRSYSERANLLTLTFIETNTNLDNKSVKAYAPKTISLEEGKIQDVPYFVCKNIWCSSLSLKNLKDIQKAYQTEAKPGFKRNAKNVALNDFNNAEKLNIDVPPAEVEKIGNYIGNEGDTLIINLIVDRCVSSTNHTGYNWVQTGYGWGHPVWTTCLWKMKDEKDNMYMLRSSSKKINEKLCENQKIRIICKITEHKDFSNLRQNWIDVSSDKAIEVLNEKETE